MKKLIALAALSLFPCLLQANPIFISEYHYVYTAIPVPTGFSNYLDLEPLGINNNNQVVGTGYIPGFGAPEAFLSSGGHSQLFLFSQGILDDVGFAINDSGTIAGWGATTLGTHAFYASASQAPVDVDGNPQRSSTARALSNVGYFAGSVNNQPALGNINTHQFTMLGSILGNDFYLAGMNDDLVLVGSGHNGGAIYDVGTGTTIQMSTILGTTGNTADAVNQNGVVAGTVGQRGYIYGNGTVTYFGTNNIKYVDGINSSNNVVGTLTNGHGFIYVASSHTVTDINTLVPASVSSVWTLAQATGINDKNSICGLATRPAKGSDSSKGWEGTVYQGFTLVIENILTPHLITPSLP